MMQSSKQVSMSDFTVKDLTMDKLRLVEVPDKATLADALNAMVKKHIWLNHTVNFVGYTYIYICIYIYRQGLEKRTVEQESY